MVRLIPAITYQFSNDILPTGNTRHLISVGIIFSVNHKCNNYATTPMDYDPRWFSKHETIILALEESRMFGLNATTKLAQSQWGLIALSIYFV